MKRLESGDHFITSIHIGGIFTSASPSIVTTVLGSCVAVCLWDPVARVGGMNHFMLPKPGDDEGWNGRYGVCAMDSLIQVCLEEGAERQRLEAKVFGGGHVLKTSIRDNNIPQSNIDFAMRYLYLEGIPVTAKDTGGYAARKISFYTDSGRVILKRLKDTGSTVEAIKQQELKTYNSAN